MRNQTRILLAFALLLWPGAHTLRAQCDATNLTPTKDFEKTSLVIDVRPEEINQFSGRSAFKNEAHIALVNMNPFLFSYKLKVEQTEIQDTGFLNFLNLLGSPVSDLIGSAQSARFMSEAAAVSRGGNVNVLIARTAVMPSLVSTCPGTDVNDARAALAELSTIRTLVLAADSNVSANLGTTESRYTLASGVFNSQKDTIFDGSTDAVALCNSANTLWQGLNATPSYPNLREVNTLKKEVGDFSSLINELRSSAEQYNKEYDECVARSRGLSYTDNLIRLADELEKLASDYERKVNGLIKLTRSYDALKTTIAKLNGRENQLLQRQYSVVGQYDISALDISVTPVPLRGDAASAAGSGADEFTDNPFGPVRGSIREARSPADSSARSNVRIVNASAEGLRVFAPHQEAQEQKPNEGGGQGVSEGGKVINAKGRIGARRFELSGGMAFSSLDRREFKSVIGFARNEQGQIVDENGNPTDKRELTNIVGLTENSSHRFAPMVMLHTRLPSTSNIFLSVGITGKKDDAGTDLEYLIGPSFLFRNMFFTFGGYAGRQQRLAGDLFLGAKLDGDDVPVRKEYRWAPAFSFTYRIPLGGKKETK